MTKPWITTIEEAREYILKEGMVGIFGSKKNQALPSLWDAVDLPVDNPDGKGWGPRVGAVWGWKNRLPQEWPDQIFYGKIKGGLAVLTSMDYLRDTLYPQAHVPLRECSATARKLYAAILNEPMTTTALRKELEMTKPPERGKFEKALKELQITLNIARLNDPRAEGDTWVPFGEQYAGFDEE
jgi:hypothetical protein